VAPSPEDIHLTKTLSACSDLFDIRVLDHVIVGEDGKYTSFLEKNLLTGPPAQPPLKIR